MTGEGLLQLSWRPYRFVLPRSLITSRGALVERSGWLLRLEAPHGAMGWGEAAAPLLTPAPPALAAALAALPAALSREALEQQIQQLPVPLACAVGMALAELDGVGGCWQRAPRSAWLLPAGDAALAESNRVLASEVGSEFSVTFKWKVAALPDAEERAVLEALLQRLPESARLRLDANGGWSRPLAWAWTERLAEEPRLQWLEQPLPAEDLEGLEQLAGRLPVALDESLAAAPALRQQWSGWQVRRPALEGDPRPLLRLLEQGQQGQRMVSTAFETGIGRRWLEHLAALQVLGPTPVAPGLAPGWCPNGSLWARDPEQVWGAARCP